MKCFTQEGSASDWLAIGSDFAGDSLYIDSVRVEHEGGVVAHWVTYDGVA